MMFFPRYLTFFILLLSQLLSASLWANNLLRDLPDFQQKIREATSPPCMQCPGQQEEKPETTRIQYEPRLKNRHIDISVISLSKARDIFRQLAANEDIPHAYVMDGCFARAMAMVQQIDDLGLTPAKAYIKGDLRVDGGKFGELRWQYHVAPVIMVKTKEGNKPYIFDPSLFNEPVPVEIWKKLILKHPKSKFSSLTYSDRYSFHPDQTLAPRNSYNEEDLELTRDIIRNHRRALEMMNYEEEDNKKSKNADIKKGKK